MSGAGEAAGDGEGRASVTSAAFWSYAGAYAERGLRFAVFVIIARFVAPAEFGVVVLALLVLNLVQDMTQNSMGQALVRQKDPVPAMFDSAFWAALAIAALATVLYLAGVLAWLDPVRQPQLRQVMLIVSPVLLISALGSVHQARLQRELGFRELSMRVVGASLASGVLAIGLALAGWGIFALAARSLLQALFQTGLLWFFCRWHPRLRWSFDSLRPLLPDGLRLQGSAMINTLNQRAFDLAAGLFLGAAALGILRVAGQTVQLLVELTVGPMTMVAFAMLARHPDDPVVGRRTFALLTQSTALLIYPAFFGLAAIADILLPWMFGAQWAQAAVFVELLALLALPIHLQLLLSAAYFAAGRTDRILHWQFALAAATMLGIAIGAPFGLWGLAIATVAHFYLLIPLGLHWLRRDTYFRVADLTGAIVPSAIGAAVMAAAVLALRPLLAGRLETPVLLGVLVMFGATLFAVAAWFIAPELVRSGLGTVARKLRRT